MAENRRSFRVISDLEAESSDLRFYRIIMIIGAVLVPVFGFMYKFTDPLVDDPMILRYTITALYLLVFVLTFYSGFVRKHIRPITYSLHVAMMTWLPYLLYITNLELNYILGYIMAFSALMLTFKDSRGMVAFIVYSFLASVLIAILVPSPHVAPLIFISSIGTTGLVLFFAVGNRNAVVDRLSENEKLLRIIFNGSADAVLLVDRDEKVIDCNERMLEIFGTSKSSVRGMPITTICSALSLKTINLLDETGVWMNQLPCTTLSGVVFWGDIAVRKLHMQEDMFYLVRISDINERKRTEEELKYKQVQLENAQQLAHIGSWEWDIEKNKITWSDELYRIFGEKPQDFLATYEEYLRCLHPDDREYVNISIQAALEAKSEFSFEHKILRRDGDIRVISSNGKVVQDRSGNVTKMFGTAHDITERKQDEQKILAYLDEIEAANKELNRFAYIVSHDLKAPLRSIGSLVSWLVQDYEDKLDEEGKQSLALLSSRVQRMHNFIEGILEYSRIGRAKETAERIDLNAVVKDVLDMIPAPSNIRIVIAKPLPHVEFDHLRITQVFQNLISNAVKFMDKQEGEITIDYRPGSAFYEYSVSDNGPGIEEKHFDKIFEIFQTLTARDEFESTGIGLTIVKKIIESKGGRIWVESEIGKGASLKFTIPADLHD